MNVTPEKIIESLIKIDKNLDEFGKIYNRIIQEYVKNTLNNRPAK